MGTGDAAQARKELETGHVIWWGAVLGAPGARENDLSETASERPNQAAHTHAGSAQGGAGGVSLGDVHVLLRWKWLATVVNRHGL